MSDAVGRNQGPPHQSDLSQVMAHGPALSQAFGPRLGALLMIFAIVKARRGPLGVIAVVMTVATAVYHVFWK
jgi:hypothetical protein